MHWLILACARPSYSDGFSLKDEVKKLQTIKGKVKVNLKCIKGDVKVRQNVKVVWSAW